MKKRLLQLSDELLTSTKKFGGELRENVSEALTSPRALQIRRTAEKVSDELLTSTKKLGGELRENVSEALASPRALQIRRTAEKVSDELLTGTKKFGGELRENVSEALTSPRALQIRRTAEKVSDELLTSTKKFGGELRENVSEALASPRMLPVYRVAEKISRANLPELVRQAVLRKNEQLTKKVIGKVVGVCIKQAKPNELQLSLLMAQYQDEEPEITIASPAGVENFLRPGMKFNLSV